MFLKLETLLCMHHSHMRPNLPILVNLTNKNRPDWQNTVLPILKIAKSTISLHPTLHTACYRQLFFKFIQSSEKKLNIFKLFSC